MVYLRQLNHLHKSYIVRKEDDSNVPVPSIPRDHDAAQDTQQIIRHWQPFKDLNQTFLVSCRAKQFDLRKKQRIVVTVEDSLLHTEMGVLEPQEEDASGFSRGD
jgi:hypothetical protein